MKMENQIKFIESYVFPKIISDTKELEDLKFTIANISRSSTIDGFMGNIIFASLEFETKDQKKKEINVVVKLMKPPSTIRTSLEADHQFVNEVFIYKRVIPTILCKFQTKFKIIQQSLWCSRIYFTEIGKYPELSDESETILVMENLAEKGFRLGHRINLTPEELTLMTIAIAQFHACTYALRINDDPDLKKLISEIIPFQFERKSEKSFYHTSYCTAFQRLFTYVDNNPEEIDTENFAQNLNLLKTKYGTAPVKLLQRFLRIDDVFSAILHGDYNRNNVLFRYEEDTAVDLRFIDFQEVKYGSIALDLSFFMYMNVHPNLFANGLNEKLINLYHKHLVESLCELLDCEQQDIRLLPYRWDNFYQHYKQFALYGAIVATMFIPWMACSEDECAKIAEEFEKDIHSEELKELTLRCGGKEIDQRIIAVLRHASKFGFMEMLQRDD